MADNDLQAVVIDNGSGSVKAGFAGPKMPGIMVGMDQKDSYVGNEAIERHGVLSLKNPIQRGLVTNWDDMEKVWHHTFYNALRVVPDEHPVLLTECPLNPKQHREEMTQIMFETFNVPAMSLGVQAVMALYTSGRTTGTVLDIGHGVTHCVPVYEGYALPHAIQRSQIGGDDVTDYLLQLLQTRGYKLTTAGEREIVRDIKETLCHVNVNRAAGANVGATPDKSYVLPDGSRISLGEEISLAPELLLQPSSTLPRLNKELGLRELYDNAMQASDADVKRDVASTIVLSGGSSLFKGLPERIENDIINGSGSSAQTGSAAGKTSVVAPPERKYGVWIGASILASLSTFQQLWMVKADYDEHGPSMVHRKCF